MAVRKITIPGRLGGIQTKGTHMGTLKNIHACIPVWNFHKDHPGQPGPIPRGSEREKVMSDHEPRAMTFTVQQQIIPVCHFHNTLEQTEVARTPHLGLDTHPLPEWLAKIS